VIEIVLFVAALFGVPLILKALLPSPSGSMSSFLIAFLPTIWSPTVLAMAFVAARDGLAGLRAELGARLAYRRGSARWILLAAAIPVLVVALAVCVARGAHAGAPFIDSSGAMQAIVLQIITGAVGEELGWRGFLLPRLGRLVGPRAAAWIMGTLWSLWHVPAFFDPSLPHYFMPMMVVLPFIAFFGVFMAFTFNRAGASILGTIPAHLSLNIMLALGGAAFTSRVFWGTLSIAFGAIAALATLAWDTASRIKGR
jgi:membrane protease YdiL (CAAX protease family)